MGQCPGTDEPGMGKMGWCRLFSGKGLSGALFSSYLGALAPLGEEASFAFSGQEGCVKTSLSSGGEGFISHVPRIWP